MLDSFFKISQRGSTVGREIRGGVVTFFTMAYIVALNPLIIGLLKMQMVNTLAEAMLLILH